MQRVCAAWAYPRASYYASQPDKPSSTTTTGKRGPKTALNDAVLRELIRANLATSPFRGEGHHKVFGANPANAARGVELRHDHGSQYLTGYFQGQSRYHGFPPSFAFVGEPETNGVVERFNRTIKEQIIQGHTYRNRDKPATAVTTFVKTYNRK